ncbi:hypothetical protein MBEHAL_2578 [Halarchaeum acidiphilum MH1-52-1]|uniref:Uncharacterized protein n=1 Tax=Halarchaeum acidiphilum MH1-52-1 TaxID=1261545 RepID=U3AGB4_9EURY|nr:hypothetical protein [Halarchaeum acidiphilum]GAD53818.1 hypothetical protein MBEHAL_2578 [Halarchaeum acidiphilum MH1-52-1]
MPSVDRAAARRAPRRNVDRTVTPLFAVAVLAYGPPTVRVSATRSETVVAVVVIVAFGVAATLYEYREAS